MADFNYVISAYMQQQGGETVRTVYRGKMLNADYKLEYGLAELIDDNDREMVAAVHFPTLEKMAGAITRSVEESLGDSRDSGVCLEDATLRIKTEEDPVYQDAGFYGDFVYIQRKLTQEELGKLMFLVNEPVKQVIAKYENE